MNVGSFVLAIWTAVSDQIDLSWAIIITIIIFDSVLLVGITIFETILYFMYKKRIDTEKTASNKLLQESAEKQTALSSQLKKEKIQVERVEKMATDVLYMASQLALDCNKEINKTIDDIQSTLDKVDTFMAQQFDDESKILSVGQEITDLEQKMNYHYDQFMLLCTSKAKRAIDAVFSKKNLSLSHSISIKQFSEPLFWLEDDEREAAIGGAKIITAFRDNDTYISTVREVGKQVFSISKNNDFAYCLDNPYFIKNNISETNKFDYIKEDKNFLEYYNCTMVVPIYSLMFGTKIYYGYLTCDTQNHDLTNEDIYDEQSISILIYAASILGTFFSNMSDRWRDAFETIADNIKTLNVKGAPPITEDDAESEFLSLVYNVRFNKQHSNGGQAA